MLLFSLGWLLTDWKGIFRNHYTRCADGYVLRMPSLPSDSTPEELAGHRGVRHRPRVRLWNGVGGGLNHDSRVRQAGGHDV